MKKTILLLFLAFQALVLHSQHHDPKVAEVKAGFSKYHQTKNIQSLYAISNDLPHGIYIYKVTLTEEDYNTTRYQRTVLYIKWVEEMIAAGYDMNFDKNDPMNRCAKINPVCSCSQKEQKALKKKWEKNDVNCKQHFKHQLFNRIMTRFACFYKMGFTKHKKDSAHLVEIIRAYCAKHDKRSDVLITLFEREVGRRRCPK